MFALNLSENRIKNLQNKLLEWGQDHYDLFPWRETNNKFHALIAEVMLQRTRAEQVIPVYIRFCNQYPSIDQAYQANDEEIRQVLHPLGLNWRITNIINLIHVLSRLNKIPFDYCALISLPGVGPYIASAFLSFHGFVRKPIIDSNVVRLWSRLFNIKSKGELRRKKWFRELVDKLTHKTKHRRFNYAVLDLTRTVCKIQPLCMNCPLFSICEYNLKNN